MDVLFNPRNVLVLGVSRSMGNMGRNIVENLLRFDYGGGIHLYGQKGGFYRGHPIHTSLEDVPDGIDLAVFLLPAQAVPPLLDQCGAKGIRYAIIETGGFSEYAGGQSTLAQDLEAAAGRHGMRFLGPNCLGAINFHNGLAVPFMALQPVFRKGSIALLAQSGGVGSVYLQTFAESNLGLSKFVSLGNKANVDEVDLLKYVASDGHTDLACLYLEDVKDGRAFFDAARGFPGPVLVQKANTSDLGARIASTHTASIAVNDRVFDGMCRQANVLRVPSMRSMLTHATVLSLPPMKGRRLAIVSRSGGHAVIAADLAAAHGFELPPLPQDVAERIHSYFRAKVIRPINPLDLGDLFDFDLYIRITRDLLESGLYDGLVFVHVFPGANEYAPSVRLAQALRELVETSGRPIAVSFLSDEGTLGRIHREAGLPLFPSPEDAMDALGAARDFHSRRALRAGARQVHPLSDEQVAAVNAWLDARPDPASPPTSADAFEVLERIGVPVARWGVARDREQAAALADRLGGPVVLKLLSRDVSHKSEVGGVVLHLEGGAQVAAAVDRMAEAIRLAVPGARVDGFLVQGMVRGVREALVGARRDPVFGPIVVTGLGGFYTELFQDVSIRLAPLTDVDVDEMLDEVQSFKALRSFRSSSASDIAFLKDVLFRVSDLVTRVPRIRDFEINPLKVGREGRGGSVLDARMVVEK
jgi:acetyltransferase